jgi:hypothetical protein
MNEMELEMVEILEKGKKEYGYLGVKAEFEAEGTRIDELLRLIEMSRKAGLNIGIKIGGCEAIRDLLEAKQIGVDYIIAPMIETPYALSKYVEAKNKVYSQFERNQTKFLFNVETQTAYNNIHEMMKQATVKDGVDGVVFGRVDYTLSKGMGRDQIIDDIITDECCDIAKICKENGLEIVVGGGVASESIPGLQKIKNIHLSRFETRKIIFSASALETSNIEHALKSAVHFELLWLKNKRAYYNGIGCEDNKRIEMLENRMQLIDDLIS